VAAKYLLAAFAAAFLAAALVRVGRGGSTSHPQARTWLIVALIFGTVSAWLFFRP